jgi:hypothetical protein
MRTRVPLEHNGKDDFGLCISPPAEAINANTSTGIPLSVAGRPDEITEAVVLDGERQDTLAQQGCSLSAVGCCLDSPALPITI